MACWRCMPPRWRFVMSELGMKDQAVLSCRDLGKSYEEGPESVVVLSGLQLELHPGERKANGQHWLLAQMQL